jgi:serine O-acetyltransferase
MASLKEIIASDLQANVKGVGVIACISALIWHPGFATIFVHRLTQHLYTNGYPKLGRALWRWNVFCTACYLHPESVIKGGLQLPHPTGIVIGETVEIGSEVTIYQNVTLGRARNAARYPVIGDGVVIFPNAVVIGGVTIGHHCVIGAGTVVDHNVAENSIVTRDYGNKVVAARNVN